MQCPKDFVGITALATLGGLLGNRIGVRPLQCDDWIEVPNYGPPPSDRRAY